MPNIMKKLSLIAGLAFPLAVMAQSFHQDIEVRIGDQQQLRTDFCNKSQMCSIVGIDFLGLPQGQLPNDWLTLTPMFVTQFENFPGVVATRNPGFFSAPDDLLPTDSVRYLVSGHLSYWDPALQRWTLAPDGTQIRLAGGLDLAPQQDCGRIFCIDEDIEGFTSFSRHGTGGAASLIVGETRRDGSLHSHLDWFLETGGKPGGPAGAYMVEMRLVSEQHPTPSEPLFVLFNHELSPEAFQQAIGDRVLQPSIDTARADKLFDWAEANRGDLFPNPTTSFVALGYYARCYDNGVCVGIKDDHIFATGGNFGDGINEIGEFTKFLEATGL